MQPSPHLFFSVGPWLILVLSDVSLLFFLATVEAVVAATDSAKVRSAEVLGGWYCACCCPFLGLR